MNRDASIMHIKKFNDIYIFVLFHIIVLLLTVTPFVLLFPLLSLLLFDFILCASLIVIWTSYCYYASFVLYLTLTVHNDDWYTPI